MSPPAESSCSCESGPEIITETWLSTAGAGCTSGCKSLQALAPPGTPLKVTAAPLLGEKQLETMPYFLTRRTGQLDQLLPFMRFSWGGGEVHQSRATSQTMVCVIPKQALPQLSRPV